MILYKLKRVAKLKDENGGENIGGGGGEDGCEGGVGGIGEGGGGEVKCSILSFLGVLITNRQMDG